VQNVSQAVSIRDLIDAYTINGARFFIVTRWQAPWRSANRAISLLSTRIFSNWHLPDTRTTLPERTCWEPGFRAKKSTRGTLKAIAGFYTERPWRIKSTDNGSAYEGARSTNA